MTTASRAVPSFTLAERGPSLEVWTAPTDAGGTLVLVASVTGKWASVCFLPEGEDYDPHGCRPHRPRAREAGVRPALKPAPIAPAPVQSLSTRTLALAVGAGAAGGCALGFLLARLAGLAL